MHRIAAHPVAYDLIQRLAGASIVHRHLRTWFHFAPGTIVLDVAGGTGVLKPMLRENVRHICLDLERPKLEGYIAKFPHGLPLQADARALPVRSGAVDAVLLALASHHLTDGALAIALKEIGRVLGKDGVLILFDPIWAPLRWPGRLLWRFDRGHCPRTAEQLAQALRVGFHIVDVKQFAVVHAYAAFFCRPKFDSTQIGA